MRRCWALIFTITTSACESAATSFGPQCMAFFEEAEVACSKAAPSICEGASEGRRRIKARGPGDYEEECRAARESLERELAASKTEE